VNVTTGAGQDDKDQDQDPVSRFADQNLMSSFAERQYPPRYSQQHQRQWNYRSPRAPRIARRRWRRVVTILVCAIAIAALVILLIHVT
jgi:hypothetical protein